MKLNVPLIFCRNTTAANMTTIANFEQEKILMKLNLGRKNLFRADEKNTS